MMNISCANCPYRRGYWCFEKEMVMWMMNKRFIAENTETLYDSEKDYRYVYWKEIEPLLNEMDIENKMIKHQSIKKILHLLYWIETKIKKWGLND